MNADQIMLKAVMGIMVCYKHMGRAEHSEMMEYIDNYPDLKTIPHHEVAYMAYKLSPDPSNEYSHHADIIESFVDLSKLLPQDSDLVKQINQYQKQPWTVSFEDLNIISEKILEYVSNKKC